MRILSCFALVSVGMFCRHSLERRASRLRPESLDLDYLDEKARELLGAGEPGELIFTVE